MTDLLINLSDSLWSTKVGGTTTSSEQSLVNYYFLCFNEMFVHDVFNIYSEIHTIQTIIFFFQKVQYNVY